MKLIVVSSEGLQKSEHEAVLLLQDSLPDNWVGYAGFLMTDIQGKTMEIDMLIFTEDRILLVELKNWAGTIEMDDRTWYQTTPRGYTIKHSSPIEIKRNHAQRIKSLFSRDLFKPWGNTFFEVQPMVVLCGDAQILRSTPTDAPLVVHINNFKNIGDKETYKEIIPQDKASYHFAKNQNLRPCNPNQIHIFDEWRRGGEAIQKRYRCEVSYIIPEFEGPAFKGPKDVYNEYIGEHTRDSEDKALVRIWNFNNLYNVDTTMTLRGFLGLREERAIRYIQKTDRQLSNDYLLNIKHDLSEDTLSVDMAEVYALPPMVERLDDYLNSTSIISAEKRLALIRSIITPLASMHAIGVYHRDLSTARLWWDTTRSAVLISGLISSKFPDMGNTSLADLRQELNSTRIIMPEDALGVTEVFGQALDVFQLGVLTYEIAYGTKLPLPKEDWAEWVEPEPENDPFEGKLHSWFQKALEPEASERFDNAGQMLEALAQRVNLQIIDTNEDKKRVLEELTSYGSQIIPMISFLQDSNFPPVQDMQRQRLAYRSNTSEGKSCTVRIFMAARPNPDNHGQSQRLLHFLERCKIASNNVVPVPKLIDFGHGMNGTHVVQEYVDGINLEEWMELGNSYEQRYEVSNALIRAIHKLHDLELSHGDLKPENILVQNNDGKLNIILLDMFDMDLDGLSPSNSMYAPKSDVSSSARDRYAVYLLVDEIFGGCADKGAYKIRGEIKNALGADLQSVPRDLELLRRTMTVANEPESETTDPIPFYSQYIAEEGESFNMDSGIYHFSARRNANRLTVFICGFTHKLTVHLTVDGENLYDYRRSFYDKMSGQDLTTDSRLFKQKNRGQMPIEQPIRMEKFKGTNTNNEFIEYIKTLPVVRHLLNTKENNEELIPMPTDGNIPIKQLWRRLVEVERETLPTVTVTKGAVEKDRAVLVQVAENIEEFQFDYNDEINVTTDQHETFFGQMDVKASGDGLLVLQPKNGSNQFRLKNIKEGTKLTLSNSGNDTSWTRRNDALSRVLAGEAVMGDLTERFISGPSGEQPPTLPSITDKQLKRYNLDESKEKAFRYVLDNPLSVLMGPPGTGKTTLSSALLHHLMTSDDVRRILVVSQSHVAADEVAVRARDLIMKLEGDNVSAIAPSIVRLGDRDRISKDMLDVHTSALQDQTRTKFHSELELRILSLSARLKLPKTFVLAAAGLYRTCGLELFSYDTARKTLNNARLAAEQQPQDKNIISKLNHSERQMKQISSSFEGRLKAYTDVPDHILHHNIPLMAALEIIAETHQVYNPQRIKRMADVIKVTHHWFQRLVTDQSGYAAFAARTRQLVVGTLVGIGSGAYQIHKNSFDMVIIDEAGRATFSELAIAMQSAKRVMLVGDHRQLAPSYDADHIQEVCRTLNLSKEEVIKTDFERAFNLNNGHMLSTQYRMAPAIGNIISQCFYGGHLKTGSKTPPEWMKSLPVPWNKTVSWIDTSGDSYLENNTFKDNSISNEAEVELISSLLRELVNTDGIIERLKEWDENDSTPPIGIITGYRKQVELLEHRLENSTWASGIRNLIKIDTIDSYQGSENRIILLSLVRHNAENKTGFMNDNARVNVALSRAKERLIIVGAGAMWVQTHAEAPLARVFEYIDSHNNRTDSEYRIVKPIDIINICQNNIEEEANA
ncbi:NERD nuclease [Photobacterium phosphoreum]|uniref:NERD nuclease n=1 Tax=Photobacterium phosphoreum TaxID=659 RepID=A0A2T3JHP5_PHOPO|nr:AAA domain-containing protein [Photobacterium phosphoreum]PSU22710.1 NERD nuclease [Photobacterium phosphoreum]PSU41244.1 NERD nuclease [Photobacterium phosphoreum]PSU48490.1 NERD nuclease [Photobacterium phosphoreum]